MQIDCTNTSEWKVERSFGSNLQPGVDCLRTRVQRHGTRLAYDFIPVDIENVHVAQMNRRKLLTFENRTGRKQSSNRRREGLERILWERTGVSGASHDCARKHVRKLGSYGSRVHALAVAATCSRNSATILNIILCHALWIPCGKEDIE